MSRFRYAALVVLLMIAAPIPSKAQQTSTPTPAPQVSSAAQLPDAPHDDAPIEWWYANARVTTIDGRHLAIVCAFFKFGVDPSISAMGLPSIPPAHYLIYGVTDLGRNTHHAYSYADSHMVDGLKTMLLMGGGGDRAASMLRTLLKGKMPEPHQLMTGPVGIDPSPLDVHYGDDGSLAAVDGSPNTYHLKLGTGKAAVDLTLASAKPVMKVNGNGETGLVKPTDMYYYSLPGCNVTGTVDGAVASGQGWIDHQWGSSWTTQKAGWDWWGAQLDDGIDILFFQQRDLATGKTFFPLATFMDKYGVTTVTHNVLFHAVPGSAWRSPRSHAWYPLAWDVDFPDENLSLRITADVDDQEMPILSPGGDIWEGSCTVIGLSSMGSDHHLDPFTASPARIRRFGGSLVRGTAYMELVGYGRPLPPNPARKQVR